jgi:transcriptional regulator with XRE-family HTH domain
VKGSELRDLIKECNLTIYKAAELLGITRQTLSIWIKSGVPTVKVAHVVETLNGLRPEKGKNTLEKGEKHPILRGKDANMDINNKFVLPSSDQVKQVAFEDFQEVELLSIEAQAGYLDAIELNETPKLDYMLIPREYEKGNYLVIEVSGSSLDDGSSRSIQDGDKLLCKELIKDHWKNKLHFKQYLFVIVGPEGIVCKQITDHNPETGEIICHSWNPQYSDYTVNLENVYKLFYVKKIVERRIKF